MIRRSTAWIFLSHSRLDLEKVRVVRNCLESAEAEPVLFFLKCLTDHDQIDELIKREIEARHIFLLCDSANARESKWVQEEVAHVRSLENRLIQVIDLDSDWELQLQGILKLLRNTKIFMSYSWMDRQAVDPVCAALAALDFEVWDPSRSLSIGDSFIDKVNDEIDESMACIIFLSVASLSRAQSFQQLEIKRALKRERVLPVLLDPPNLIQHLIPTELMQWQWYDFSDRNVDLIVQRLIPTLVANHDN